MSKYREIDVKKQRNMTWGETFHLCIRGVKHRLLRSVLTLAVVVLAVAFFMFLLSESMIVQTTGKGVASEISENRVGQVTFTRMLEQATELITVRRLATASILNDEKALKEFATVTEMDVAAVSALAKKAYDERTYLDWFDNIPSGRRLVLVHKNFGRDAIEFALEDRTRFFEDLAPMIDLRVPGKKEGLAKFFEGYKPYRSELTAFNNKWNEKIVVAREKMQAAKGDFQGTDEAWIIQATEEQRIALQKDFAAVGFAFTADDMKVMYEQFAEAALYDRMFAVLSSQELREIWAKEFRETQRSSAEDKFKQFSDKRAIKLMTERGFTEAELQQIQARTKKLGTLTTLERKLSGVVSLDNTKGGLSGRQIFLLSISFVVCMVGITNAMLMSITERFREIATMKCLGATDRYILLQFMMEAGLQGFFGGILGVVIGFVISILRGSISYGSYMWTYWSTSGMLLCAFASLLAGVALAILASVHPSWSASRMAPMEAMRVE
ncbi:MAG: ABC transporter permease [Kiritimatiellae bacterium]|nr:ABC transporter permease [Kiritimatiellia bacterium]